jgi:chemotaxis protein CheD
MSEMRVPVLIGEARVAGAESLIFTIGLGSCVAIVLYDEVQQIGGLAHAMLPSPSNGRRNSPPSRFASSAVPELLRLMLAAGAEAARVRARLAGGASMFDVLLSDSGRKLGLRNVHAAREALDAHGIPLVGEDTGGAHGRSVFLRNTDGRLIVTSVAHPDVVL